MAGFAHWVLIVLNIMMAVTALVKPADDQLMMLVISIFFIGNAYVIYQNYQNVRGKK